MNGNKDDSVHFFLGDDFFLVAVQLTFQYFRVYSKINKEKVICFIFERHPQLYLK